MLALPIPPISPRHDSRIGPGFNRDDRHSGLARRRKPGLHQHARHILAVMRRIDRLGLFYRNEFIFLEKVRPLHR